MNYEERQQFADIIYSILISTELKSFKELDDHIYISTKKIINSYKNISPEQKVILNKVLNYLFKSIKNNLLNRKSSN